MDNKKNESGTLIIILAFLLGLVIGMFVSPINGISIGSNNFINGSDGGCDDDDDNDEDAKKRKKASVLTVAY